MDARLRWAGVHNNWTIIMHCVNTLKTYIHKLCMYVFSVFWLVHYQLIRVYHHQMSAVTYNTADLQAVSLTGCKSAVLCVYIMLYVSKHLCSSTLRVLSLAVSFGYFVKSAFWLVVITGHSTSICLCKIFMLLSLICLFLSRVSMLTRDIDIANRSVRLFVCPSVCPSVRNVPVSDENDLTWWRICPIFGFWPIFPTQNPLKRTFRWPAYSPGVTLQNDYDFSIW